ncbi:MAG: GNAT family N-acetyltransferase [Proteobacteria bacterium]|nr:GNAT family N-acetyltransferase [Pseudomonadota bacterium]
MKVPTISQENLLKSARNLTPEANRGKQGIAVTKPKVEIREAQTSDARKLNQYIRATFASSRHLITRKEEFGTGPFKQRFWIAKKQTNPLEVCFVASTGKNIVGMLDNWTDRRQRVAHVTCFAMSVAEDRRGKGLGKALLKTFIDWVKKHPSLTRVELHVHSDNAGAIKLYESCGFEHEGVRKNAVRYEDGRVVDDIIMALWP